MYLKKQDILDKKSPSIFYFVCFYHRLIMRECALCTWRQEQIHIHSNPVQSIKYQRRREATTKAAVIDGAAYAKPSILPSTDITVVRKEMCQNCLSHST